MENSIFTLDVFFVSLPIYLACIVAGFMLAIKPKRSKNKALSSFSQELYEESSDNEDLKLENLEDFDLYLNVSEMFRKNGEFEKAVRIHYKMLDDEKISDSLKSKILLELGKDYLASGIFDKAEESLLACLNFSQKGSDEEFASCTELSKLYERQLNWEQAVIYRKRISQDDEGHKSGLALLLCNLAKREIEKKNIGNAKKNYQEALDLDKDCILAIKELITISLTEQKYEEAFNLLKNYSLSSKRLLNLLDFAFEALINQKELKDKTMELLSQIVKSENSSYELGILYCNKLKEENKKQELQDFIEIYTENHKNKLQAIYSMAVFLKELGSEYNSKSHHNVLLEKIENMLKKEYNYQCGSCGYHTKQEFWYCPQCQKWNTIERIYR